MCTILTWPRAQLPLSRLIFHMFSLLSFYWERSRLLSHWCCDSVGSATACNLLCGMLSQLDCARGQKGKNSTANAKKVDPPIAKKSTFRTRPSPARLYITFYLHISKPFFCLPLDMLIEIHNRIPIGLAVGFSIFPPDEENEEYFVILYLLIIEIRLAWWQKKSEHCLRLHALP